MSEVKLVGYSSDGLEAKWHLYIFPHNEKRYYAKGLTFYDQKIVRYVGLMPKPNKSHWDINNSDDCIIKQIKKIQDAYGKGIPQSQSVLRKPSWAKLDNGDGKGFEGDIKPLSQVIDPRLIIFKKHANKNESVPLKIKSKALSDNRWLNKKCCYCNIWLTPENCSREHIVPSHAIKAKTHTPVKNNIRPCCKDCNTEKGGMMLNVYIQYLNFCQWKSTVGSNEYKLLQTKIINANEIAKEIGK